MSFKGYLKQSTAVDVLAGPHVDDTDGNTDETALTITPADVRLSKNGANMAAKNEATSLVHDELGMYVCKFDATDTNTVGILELTIHEGGALTVVHTWQVVEEAIYDALFASGASLQDAIWDTVLTGTSHNDATSAGRRLRQVEAAFTLASGTLAAVSGHTVTLDAGAVATADFYIGSRVQIIEGVGTGQSRLIISYTSGKVATLDSEFTTTPNTASLYEVVSADVHVSASDSDLAKGFIATYTNVTTVTLDAAAVATEDYYVGEMLVITHGLGQGQAREITAYTSGRVATLSPALITALDTTSGYHIQPHLNAPTVAEIIAALAPEVRYNTAQAGAGTTITLDSGASAVNDYYNGALILIVGGTGATDPPQIRVITGYVGSSRIATVATWAVNPDVTSVFLVLGLN